MGGGIFSEDLIGSPVEVPKAALRGCRAEPEISPEAPRWNGGSARKPGSETRTCSVSTASEEEEPVEAAAGLAASAGAVGESGLGGPCARESFLAARSMRIGVGSDNVGFCCCSACCWC